MPNDERDVARVDEQPLSGSAELPQRPTGDVPPTAPEKTKRLYVVTSGCYSDYSIVAIFNDRVLADRYCEGSDDSSGYGSRVEEYDLNPHEAEIRAGLKAHYVALDRDGNVINHSEAYGGDARAGSVQLRCEWNNRTTLKRYRFEATIIAKTKEQAIKAANEQRARWIAEDGDWPEDE